MPDYTTSVFIFRRDLRLHDNTGLNAALRHSKNVIPCFIFDPRQIERHAYQSKPGLNFMVQAIEDLEQQLNKVGGELVLCNGEAHDLINQLFKRHRIEAVFINRDYTPFSRLRDSQIADSCKHLGVALHVLPDALLTEPEQAMKADRTPYKVFTAFYNHAKQFQIAPPQPLEAGHFLSMNIEATFNFPISMANEPKGFIQGGRQHALSVLDQIGTCGDYADSRNYPHKNATSRLSAHLKFGTCSVREVYYAIAERLGRDHPLLRQLYWRDFFTHIGFHFPSVFGHAFLQKFDKLAWGNNPDYFRAWCKGETGFPIVDAGMRELNTTGFMHNRVRMITASFLVKDLHIDWRWGERYFAQQLVDYDPCVNNGNWQWVASTGCDAQPYFRIFNPWTQQKKFDLECRYIYRWIPELNAIPVELIHRWDKNRAECGYPAPIIDHAWETRITKAQYSAAAQHAQQDSKLTGVIKGNSD
jgi:deoxyribodipyrimidine photo-lyase